MGGKSDPYSHVIDILLNEVCQYVNAGCEPSMNRTGSALGHTQTDTRTSEVQM